MIRVGALAVLLSGCSTISHVAPPSDWPQLKLTQHYVSTREMRDQCVKWTPPFMSPMACAEINFDKMTCDQWFDADFVTPEIVEHENEHWRGKDHAGSTYLRDLWENWKRAQKK